MNAKVTLLNIYKYYIASMFVILLFIFIVPIYFLICFERTKKTAFYLHVIWSYCFRIFAGYWFIRYKQFNDIPSSQFILISNHKSYLDIFLLYSMFPKKPFLFLGKAELMNYPVFGILFRKLNIPVYRNDPRKAALSVKQSIEAVRKGWSLVIFPEGGISAGHNIEMVDFKEGAFVLSKKLKLPITLLAYHNNYELFSDPAEPDLSLKPGVVEVSVLKTIDVDTVNRLSVLELKELCFKQIDAELKHHKK